MSRRHYGCVAVAAALTVSCVAHKPGTTTAARPTPAPSAMERQIRNAIDAGDGDYRTKVLRQRVAAEPNNVEVRLELAAAYRDRGYPDIALEHCRLAAARFPESGAVQLALARTLRDMNLRTQAVEGLKAFLDRYPQRDSEYLAWIGIIRDEMGQWPAGEAAHRAAIQLEPAADYLHNNLGYNLLMQGNHEKAAAEFQQALKLNPESRVARNNLGLALANTDARQQAVRYWESGTDPATAHNNLAAYLIEKGAYAEARKELEIALGYNRQHPAALRNLELVSRSEGTPATLAMHQQPAGNRWDRWKSSVRKLFVGPLQDKPATGATAAGPADFTGEN